jgi:hypothetical protein
MKDARITTCQSVRTRRASLPRDAQGQGARMPEILAAWARSRWKDPKVAETADCIFNSAFPLGGKRTRAGRNNRRGPEGFIPSTIVTSNAGCSKRAADMLSYRS